MAGSLDGRVALVTGVSGNLGPTWVEALAAAGATVVGFDVSPAGREVPRLAGFGACDVTSREDTSRAFAEAAAAQGIPDVLVNTAGVDTPPSAGGAPAGIEGVQPRRLR
ncbi:MAG: SDR family NAD(P)-dependent oxidoreductase, partial [Solirubrobacteraceae bacterium]